MNQELCRNGMANRPSPIQLIKSSEQKCVVLTVVTLARGAEGIFLETVRENLDKLRQADSVTTLKELNEGIVDERAREYVRRQETLYFSELLEGQARSENDFVYKDGRMICIDADGFELDWLELHDNGVKYARQRANEDPGLIPYIYIAQAEKLEAELQHDLINQKTPRTLVSYSLCGNDLFDNETLISLGRSPYKKRGFVRVSVFDGQGSMRVMVRSIDGLNALDVERQSLELGINIPKGMNTAEILNSPLILNYADYALADQLAPTQGMDTFKFVCEQTDLINAHMSGLESIAERYVEVSQCAQLSEDLRYDIVSSLKQRLEGSWRNYGSLGKSIASAGNVERAAGTEYYGCDTTVSARSLSNKLGYFYSGEEKTDCVTCGVCSRVVNLPKGLHAIGFSHCVECRSTLDRKHGRLLTKQETDILLGKQSEIKSMNQKESLSQWWKRIGVEVKNKQKLNRQKEVLNQKKPAH